MSCKMRYAIIPVVLLWILIPILQANSTFIPDSTFKGSTLAGWHVLGQADWKAENGELIGTPKQGGGWLVMDHSYQDVALYSVFKCTGGCKTGVLLRAEKTAEGMKGVLVEIAGRRDVDLRAGQECVHADIDDQAAAGECAGTLHRLRDQRLLAEHRQDLFRG